MAEASQASRQARCSFCGEDFLAPRRRGPAPSYCTPGHRKAAYRARRGIPPRAGPAASGLPARVHARVNRNGSVTYQARYREGPGRRRAASFPTVEEAVEFLAGLGRSPRPRGPAARAKAPWAAVYGDLGPDEAGRALARFRSELFERGLSERSIYLYLGMVRSAQAWCAEHATNLGWAPGPVIAAWAETLTPARAEMARGALAHYWRSTRRLDPPLGPLSARARGQAPAAPRAPRRRRAPAWSSPEYSTAAARLEAVRRRLQRRELALRTQETYLATLWRAERYFAARGWDLAEGDEDQMSDYLASVPPGWASRKVLKVALGDYWAALERADPPLWLIRVPPRPRSLRLPLEDHEAAALVARARARRDRPALAVMVGLYAALRCAEVAALRWDAVGGDGWLSVVGKGEVAARVPIHPALLEALGWVEPGGGPWIFPGRFAGDHVATATVWAWVRQVAVEAGLGPERGTHVLRRTALSAANDATGDLRAVQDFARHSNPSTTAGYTRTTARRLVGAVTSIAYGAGDTAAPEPARLPSLSYQDAIRATEGAHAVEAWVELGAVLARRPRWRFEVTADHLARWVLDGSALWAVATQGLSQRPGQEPVAVGRPSFELFQDVPGRDEASVWSLPGPAELAELASSLVQGGDAPGPDHRLGPWVEAAWVEALRPLVAPG